ERGRVQVRMTRHSVMRTPLAGHENETVLRDCFKRVFAALRQKPSIVPSSYLFSLKVNLLNVSFYSVSVSRSLQTSLRLKIVRFSGVF
ncbi:MAG: hypothetical protein ABF968_14755, partial [Acetobacter sp.]